ncbi:MAG: acyl carrier protein [Myxococcota bacterium]|nr:acyl carrier protein [Myxococcota bacterium]
MTPETIRQVLSDIAHEELAWQGALPDAELASAFDSMQRLTLVVAVEDRFRICLDPDDEERIRTVDDLVGVIRGKLDA